MTSPPGVPTGALAPAPDASRKFSAPKFRNPRYLSPRRPPCDALDLKVDLQEGRLLVHAVHFEPHAPSDVMDAIAEELAAMADGSVSGHRCPTIRAGLVSDRLT
jgi:hypothetical protein